MSRRAIARTPVLLAMTVMVAGLFGCVSVRDPAPEAVVQTTNAGYRVERLFTDEKGNAVYRFRDRGEYRYYVTGPANPQLMPAPPRPAEGTATAPEPN